jgi:hypothetical protein
MTKQKQNGKDKTTLEEMVKSGSQLILCSTPITLITQISLLFTSHR